MNIAEYIIDRILVNNDLGQFRVHELALCLCNGAVYFQGFYFLAGNEATTDLYMCQREGIFE
ncbi:hypothetical protein D3C73_1649490 [compost metagenome]